MFIQATTILDSNIYNQFNNKNHAQLTQKEKDEQEEQQEQEKEEELTKQSNTLNIAIPLLCVIVLGILVVLFKYNQPTNLSQTINTPYQKTNTPTDQETKIPIDPQTKTNTPKNAQDTKKQNNDNTSEELVFNEFGDKVIPAKLTPTELQIDAECHKKYYDYVILHLDQILTALNITTKEFTESNYNIELDKYNKSTLLNFKEQYKILLKIIKNLLIKAMNKKFNCDFQQNSQEILNQVIYIKKNHVELYNKITNYMISNFDDYIKNAYDQDLKDIYIILRQEDNVNSMIAKFKIQLSIQLFIKDNILLDKYTHINAEIFDIIQYNLQISSYYNTEKIAIIMFIEQNKITIDEINKFFISLDHIYKYKNYQFITTLSTITYSEYLKQLK